MAYVTIRAEQRDGVGLITLNRPDVLNALSTQLLGELDAALAAFERDDGVACVILTGAGDRAFSAGADIHEMVGLSEEEQQRRNELRNGYVWRLADYSKPTIGALNGLAYGGAALMVSTLDLRIGCERTKLRFLGASYGRVNSTWTLPLIVGWPMAKELLFTGRVVEADEALRVGLLNRLVPSERLLETALELGAMIAKNDQRMVQGIKRLLHRGVGLGYAERAHLEAEARETWLRPVPPREGFRDFLARKGRA